MARFMSFVSLLSILSLLQVVTCSIDIGMGQSFEDAIDGMQSLGRISSEQASTLLSIMGEDAEVETETHTEKRYPVATVQLRKYLASEVASDSMSQESALSIQAMLGLIKVNPAIHQANTPIATNNQLNVQLLGRWQAPEEFQLYNGIWGYSAPDGREYALTTNSIGINIVDITNPSTPSRVQFIRMPGGDVWRDVATHLDPASGKTYAYVAGQTVSGPDADLWILDLSYLPDQIPEGDGYKLVPGYPEDGHTLNVDDGYLFLNTAFASRGIKILDLTSDPYNPTYIAQYLGGDGHDSFLAKGLNVSGQSRNILISSDGWTQRTRFIDITELRSIYAANGFVTIREDDPLVISQSLFEFPTYQHSSALSEDGNYVYLFEEFNTYDMAIYDISDVLNPQRIGTFQWSGERRFLSNSIVHNGRVKGNYLHVAYYTAGYRVFDISNPTSPVEVGFYDSFCELNGCSIADYGEFDGGWNVYTDLASGNILMSDTVGGLHIFAM